MTDAAILAKSTSGAIVVVSTDTNRHQLEAAIETLVTVGARVAGVVMTKVPTRAGLVLLAVRRVRLRVRTR